MPCRFSATPTTWMSFCFAVLLFVIPLRSSSADDWPQWGGPKRDCVWREDGIVESLPPGPLPRVWSTPLGEGYSGPAVADGRVFITDYQPADRQERVLCLNAETGKVLWQHAYDVRYTVSYAHGPRATPVVDGNRVYTIGTQGDMFCFDVEQGEILWKKDFVEEYGTALPNWGMAASPLVDDEQLITLVGGSDGACLVSFDKMTGQELWRAIDDPAVGYAPPVIYEFDGVRQLIAWHPTAITSLNPETGEKYWEFPFDVRVGLTVPMPQQQGNRLFVTSFYNGPRMLEVSSNPPAAKLLWRGNSDSEKKTDGLHSIMPTPIFTESHIYGVCSFGQLRCLDAQQGDRVWETFEATGEDRWWNAFLIPHKDRVFICNEQGELIIARLTPEGYEELSRAELLEPTRKVRRRLTIWSHPAFAMQSVFARNDKEIVRVNLAAE
ncbi:outer membrane biogenesis protein BamB [Symmachiella dynata]|uniref:PQQ-binding-like beta-propeller repeat protein n=1 Tax=Symmachiella dynata TaxID=2527995 RepID=UPI00118AE987|nr:PQQ-binding-like beta-propeller repeat protein [Symmachiella dynata]QDT47635.1 outer membrane biogenesis protein BamB [Symmachiella dynata]